MPTPAAIMPSALNTEFNREASIWEETNVIGVARPHLQRHHLREQEPEIMDDALIAALQNAFINIGNTDEGRSSPSRQHNGYQKAQSSDYDRARRAEAHSGASTPRTKPELSQTRE